MASEQKSSYLPRTLKDQLGLLSIVGLPVGGIWGLLVRYWQSTTGQVEVSIRLLLVSLAALITLAVVMFWSWLKRPKARRVLRLDELPLEIEERDILTAIGLFGKPVSMQLVRDKGNLPKTHFAYHWHRLEHHFKLIKHDGKQFGSYGDDMYSLSQLGREYAIKVLGV